MPVVLQVLTGGFFVAQLPNWIGWLKYLSYIYYALGEPTHHQTWVTLQACLLSGAQRGWGGRVVWG